MKYAYIANGIVVDIVVNGDPFVAFSNEWYAAQFVEASEGVELGWVVTDGVLAPPVPDNTRPVLTVSAAQFRLSLSKLGKLDTVLAWVATQEQIIQQAWEYAVEFHSDATIVAAVAEALNVSAIRMQALFSLAATIDINSRDTFSF